MPNLKEMAVNSHSWSRFFSVRFSEYSGYVTNWDDACKLIKEYEVNTTTSFIATYQTKGFANLTLGKIALIAKLNCKKNKISVVQDPLNNYIKLYEYI